MKDASSSWLEYATLARDKFNDGKTLDALQLYEKAISLEADEAWPYIKLASLITGVEERLDLYKAAIHVEPENFWGYVELVTLLKDNHEPEKALRECEIGRQRHPKNNELDFLHKALTSIVKKHKVLLVSILFFYPGELSIHFLDHVPELVILKCQKLDIKPIFAFRNNSVNFDNSEILEKIGSLRNKFSSITFAYTEGSNIGFGGGHNLNFNQHDSDIFLILNDDIGLPHFDGIEEADSIFDRDSSLAAIGAYRTPTHIQEDFSYVPAKEDALKHRDYAEASILFVRSSAFCKVGGFDEKMEYAYFEDSDLSLRLKQIGYGFTHIDIPHQHFRSTSALKIPEAAGRTVYEYNRARFLSKWSNYLKTRRLHGKVLINLLGDGIGDLVDCYYPVAQLVRECEERGVSVDLSLGKSKLTFLYESLSVNIIEQNKLPIDSCKEYDQVYRVDDINYSPPFHTLDLIAGKIGVTEFSYSEKAVKDYVLELGHSEEISNIPHLHQGGYAVVHLDSQRGGFEGRAPKLKECISALNSLAKQYPILLVGLYHSEEQRCMEYENFIDEHQNIFDIRDVGTIQDMSYIISKANFFFGVDSGPMHLAQLFNIPSFVLYGPIHPLTKIYRYDNSGAFYNLESSSGSGYYHKYLEPGYYFCMRRDEQCIQFIESESLRSKIDEFLSNGFQFNWNDLFEPLRYRQREWLFLQYHNPLFKNRLLNKSVLKSKAVADLVMEVCEVFEDRTADTVNHHVNQFRGKVKLLEEQNIKLRKLVEYLSREQNFDDLSQN